MTSPQDQARESNPAVFAVAGGLFLIAISALTLFSVRMTDIDGDALLDERFVDHQLPDGMAVVDAMQLARGEQVVVLSDPDSWTDGRADEALVWDPITKKQEANRGKGFEGHGGGRGPSRGRGGPGRGRGHGSGRGGDSGKSDFGGEYKPVDWNAVELGPVGQAPWELAFVWYPRELAEKVLTTQFGRRGFGDLRFVGQDGGKVTVALGSVVWAGYDTHYVIERQFAMIDETKAFRDTLRVNLSLGTLGCVLYARWSQGIPGSIESVSTLLEGFTPGASG